MPEPRHPLDHLVDRSVIGDAPDAVLRSVAGASCAVLLARKDRVDNLAGALGIGARVGTVSALDTLTAWCVAPGRWWVVADRARTVEPAAALAGRLGTAGHVSDQSQARVLIRISGPRCRDILAKGCTLDLDRFAPGTCAQTQIAHISTAMAATDDGFDLLVPSGFAVSFWDWLTASAAEFRAAVAVR